MVALETHHVAETDFLLGLDVQGHTMGKVLAGDIVPIVLHAITHLVEHGPHAEVTNTGGTEIHRGVCGREVEVLVPSREIALSTGKVDDIMLVDHLNLWVVQFLPIFVGDGSLAITQGESSYPCSVGVPTHVSVGDADGYPHRATVSVDGITCASQFRRIAFRHDFHIPYLVGIADAERLTI